jgi:hypothetical protein
MARNPFGSGISLAASVCYIGVWSVCLEGMAEKPVFLRGNSPLSPNPLPASASEQGEG